MSAPPPLRLTEPELDALANHYSGNCFGCERCSFYFPILEGEPGAVEAYVKFMRERYGEAVETEPAGAPGSPS